MTSVELRAVLLDQDAATTVRLALLLDENESRRAAAFHFARDRTRWITARATLRILLGRHTAITPAEVPIGCDEKGKPFLPGHLVHFNLSHADDHALIVLSATGPVGVDLERFSRGAELADCTNAFLHPAETRRLHALPDPAARHHALIRIWCAKEAYLKALGTGLSLPPEHFTVEWETERCARVCHSDALGFLIHFPESPATYCAAVALPPGLACPEITWFDPASSSST